MSYMSDTASHAIFQLNRFKAYGATVDKIAHCPLTRGTVYRNALTCVLQCGTKTAHTPT